VRFRSMQGVLQPHSLAYPTFHFALIITQGSRRAVKNGDGLGEFIM